MEEEIIIKIETNDAKELLLSLGGMGKPMYQYIYRAGRGVYWEQKNHAFKSTSIKEWSCSQWFFHIVSVVKSELGVDLKLSKNVIWQIIPEEDKKEIIQKHAV